MKLWQNLITYRSLTSYHFHKRLKRTTEARRFGIPLKCGFFGHFLRECLASGAHQMDSCQHSWQIIKCRVLFYAMHSAKKQINQ